MYDDDEDEGENLPQPTTPDGLIDQEAIATILEKAKDALRPLGLTLRLDGVVIQIQEGNTYAMMPVLIRPSAKSKLEQDKKSIEEFNKMMAASAEAYQNEEAKKIAKVVSDPDALRELLFQEVDDEEETELESDEQAACQHLRPHPVDGFCLDCGKGLSH